MEDALLKYVLNNCHLFMLVEVGVKASYFYYYCSPLGEMRLINNEVVFEDYKISVDSTWINNFEEKRKLKQINFLNSN